VLSDIVLDDLRFQELVSEARTRIARHSPGWTEHNVSDPGITLIELFAWFTDILLYRVNRIPEQLHLALLELVGVTPAPPRQARAGVRFMLERPSPGLTIPEGTEIAAPRTSGQDAIVFRTTESLTFPSTRLPARMLEPTAPDQAVLLGFDQPLSGLVIRLELEASPADDIVGDTSVVWEASGPAGAWSPADVIEDETDGLRLGSGAITLALPEQTSGTAIGEHHLHWLRCRAAHRPAIGSIDAFLVGATVPAHHAGVVRDEPLGPSEGVPGVRYPLRYRPVLALEPGETLQVREPGGDEWVDWELVASFERSNAEDRHFMLDLARGEVRLGPAIRQPDGGWRRFGAVPRAGAAMRFSRYRHGGGLAGNVATGALTVLPAPLPGVVSVTNPQPATGGADAESLEGARRRAALELRGRTRAVTAEDFERLTLAASPQVGRALCATPEAGGAVRVHVVPQVESPDRLLSPDELAPEPALMERLTERLEAHRLIGTSILLAPARLRGVSVAVEVGAAPLADPERVRQDVEHALYTFLNPLVGGSPDGPGDGWPVGRALNQGELFGIVYDIAGVRAVNVLRVYETNLRTGEQAAQPTESHLTIGADELIASGRHFVRVMRA
jgi:hypothetical protein